MKIKFPYSIIFYGGNVMSVRDVFNEYFNGEPNFVTPNVYGFGTRKFGDYTLLYEKSCGERIFSDEGHIYAVTFLLYNKGNVEHLDLGKAFGSKSEVEEYIKSIKSDMLWKADRIGETKRIVNVYF